MTPKATKNDAIQAAVDIAPQAQGAERDVSLSALIGPATRVGADLSRHAVARDTDTVANGLADIWRPSPFRAYRLGVTQDVSRTCALCGDPIEADQAWMATDGGETAHSGCVYSSTDAAERDRWMPPDSVA
jgi:hypothetical protein